MKKILCLTGGGDAVGLNAAIAGLVRSSADNNIEVVGVIGGWQGLVTPNPETMLLNPSLVSGIVSKAGTLLHTSRENPLKSDGKMAIIAGNMKNYAGLVAMGGDDTLSVACALSERGLNVFGVPKTMDLDLAGTDYSVGFWSYVDSVAQAVRCFTETCNSHRRIGVCEIFGRHSGFTTAAIGIASDADYIIIPEQELNTEVMANTVKHAYQSKGFAMVVVAEGINLDTGSKGQIDPHDNESLKQKRIGEFVASLIEGKTSIEARAFQASHPFRGDPSSYDVIAGYRLGLAAGSLVAKDVWGRLLVIKGDIISGTVDVADMTSFKPRRLLNSGWLYKAVKTRNQGF